MLRSPPVLRALCGLLGVFVYLNTLDCKLCYDDLPAIVNNQDLRPNQSWANLLKNDFWGTALDHNDSHKSYRPLCVATFKLNYLLHELEPMGYHLVNILLHGVVCYLYVQLVSLVLSEVWPALIAGLLFAVHPIHTEAVASVVGRADCLSGVFFLLSLLCYHKATQRFGVSVWMLLSLLSCVAATLCKETGLTVLALCLVYDLCIASKIDLGSIVRLQRQSKLSSQFKGLLMRGAVLMVFGATVIMARLRINNGLPTFGIHDNPNNYLPSPWRQLNWLHLCFVNIWLMLNPSPLSCDWRVGAVPSISSLIDPGNVASIITLLCVIGLWLYSFSGRLGNGGIIVFGVSLLVFPYLPASNLFFPVGFVVAERILYLPSMGLCLLVAHGVWQAMKSSKKHIRVLLSWVLISLLMTHCLKTVQRNRDWLSNEVLFGAAVRVFPQNGLMLNNVGQELLKRGNTSQAVGVFRRSVEAAPHIALLHLSLAKALKDTEEYGEAEMWFQQAMYKVHDEQNSDLASKIFCEYGTLLTREENLHNTSALRYALRLWESAHELQPDDVKHLHNKGFALLKLGRLSEAKESLERVLTESPDHYGATYKLGEVLLGLGDLSAAELRFKTVLRLNNSDLLAKFQLASLLMKPGSSAVRLHEAQTLLEDVTEAEPLNDNALFALAVVHYNQRHLPLAEQLFLRTLDINSTHTNSLYNLGVMYVQTKRCPEAIEMLSRLIDLQPLHERGLSQLAACHVYQNNLHSAAELYEQALVAATGQADWNTLANYGVVQRELGHLNRAEELLTSALSLTGANKDFISKELSKTKTLLMSTS